MSKSNGKPNKTIRSGFWSNVEKGNRDDCWIWTGTKNVSGYGIFCHRNTTIAAHRFSWVLKNGAIPPGLFVCHSCDNPSCVNPFHLWVGTNEENLSDMQRKRKQGSSRYVNRPKKVCIGSVSGEVFASIRCCAYAQSRKVGEFTKEIFLNALLKELLKLQIREDNADMRNACIGDVVNELNSSRLKLRLSLSEYAEQIIRAGLKAVKL